MEWIYGYRENDELGGDDPYAASKACAELVVNSYTASFLKQKDIPVSTARAGNVIGGGDISNNRIIPDCIRAVLNNKAINIRNPGSVRPYHHVLEPLAAYLLIAKRQYGNTSAAGSYNVGPKEESCVTTAELADAFCKEWGSPARWETSAGNITARHEAGLLRLDCTKIYSMLNWSPVWDIKKAVEMTVKWEKARLSGVNIREEMNRQISQYLK
jgi:CDP-glucose 4,6-dehydratase